MKALFQRFAKEHFAKTFAAEILPFSDGFIRRKTDKLLRLPAKVKSDWNLCLRSERSQIDFTCCLSSSQLSCKPQSSLFDAVFVWSNPCYQLTRTPWRDNTDRKLCPSTYSSSQKYKSWDIDRFEHTESNLNRKICGENFTSRKIEVVNKGAGRRTLCAIISLFDLCSTVLLCLSRMGLVWKVSTHWLLLFMEWISFKCASRLGLVGNRIMHEQGNWRREADIQLINVTHRLRLQRLIGRLLLGNLLNLNLWLFFTLPSKIPVVTTDVIFELILRMTFFWPLVSPSWPVLLPCFVTLMQASLIPNAYTCTCMC